MSAPVVTRDGTAWKPFKGDAIVEVYLNETVLEAGRRRTAWLFDEFETIVVNFSGGKDSVVCLQLALEEAEHRGRLPLKVMFLDQEAEWQTVIDFVRETFADPRIEPYWLQVPFRIFNATSHESDWLVAWEPGKEWMRPKEPNSIHDNVFGTDRFKDLFDAFLAWLSPNDPAIFITGVRAEESPSRRAGLTSYETHKGETWGRIISRKRQHFVFCPIYDWSLTDVWKAIHEGGGSGGSWPYSAIYDYQYQYGLPLSKMRVSNLHHETAIETLFYLQEIEGKTWERAVARIPGINSAGHLKASMQAPKQLPPMFRDWKEYRDHLLENLVDPEKRPIFRKKFEQMERMMVPEIHRKMIAAEIAAILVNDWHGTKLDNFKAAHRQYTVNAGKGLRKKTLENV